MGNITLGGRGFIPCLRLSSSIELTLSPSTSGNITWDYVNYSQGWDITLPTDTITIPVDGIYVVLLDIYASSIQTVDPVAVYIHLVQGGNDYPISFSSMKGGYTTHAYGSALMRAGDSLRVEILTTEGNTFSFNAGPPMREGEFQSYWSPQLTIYKVI